MKRRCHSCPPGHAKEATIVASDKNGLCWFECGEHGPTDNPGGVIRTKQTPIADWFESIGISLDDVDELEEPCPETQR